MSSDHRLVGIVVIVLLALGLNSCGGGIITFTFTEDSDEQTIEGSNNPVGDVLGDLNPLTFNINLEQKLEKRDAKGAKRVELRDLKLKVTDYAGDGPGNFNFLDSIEFYVDSNNQERKRLAWLNDVPKGKQTLSLNVDSSINLKPYIEDGMSLETSAEGSPPDHDTTIKGVVKMWVKAL